MVLCASCCCFVHKTVLTSATAVAVSGISREYASIYEYIILHRDDVGSVGIPCSLLTPSKLLLEFLTLET